MFFYIQDILSVHETSNYLNFLVQMFVAVIDIN